MASSATYYAHRGRTPRNCWTCDHTPCSCCRIEMRKRKRGAKQRWREEDRRAAEERE